MPAILGPGSVSLETCAQTRKLESIYRISFPRRGLFLQKERDRLSKRLIRETEGVIEHALLRVFGNRDHHSARQTGCVQPTLTPPTDRRRTVAMLGLRRLRTWR
jgi:hypothetical protein